MNPHERELLTTFLQQMIDARAGQKDPDAEALIRQAVAQQPDAAYLLVQRAMGLDYALQAAQAQAAKLQAELDQVRARSTASFLDAPNAWGRPAAAPNPAQSPLPPLASSPASLKPVARPGAAPAAGSAGSGLLANLATTAAGVVAGSFLYQGIQGLMGHHGQGGGWGAPAAGFGNDQAAAPLTGEEVADAIDDDGSSDSLALDDGGDFGSDDLG